MFAIGLPELSILALIILVLIGYCSYKRSGCFFRLPFLYVAAILGVSGSSLMLQGSLGTGFIMFIIGSVLFIMWALIYKKPAGKIEKFIIAGAKKEDLFKDR